MIFLLIVTATVHLALTADENPPLDAQDQAKADHQGLLDCRPAGAGE
jgi:hypothetical protein